MSQPGLSQGMSQGGMSQQMSQFSQGYIYPSQGFSQDVPEISQTDPGDNNESCDM